MFAWLRKASRSEVEDLRSEFRRLKADLDDWLEKADRRLARIRMREAAQKDREQGAQEGSESPFAHLDPISRLIHERRRSRGLLSPYARNGGGRRSGVLQSPEEAP